MSGSSDGAPSATEKFSVVTERLTLRTLTLDDFDQFHTYRSDASVAEFQGWEPSTKPETMTTLRTYIAGPFFVDGTWFQIGIARTEDDLLVGDIGLCIDADSVEFGISLSSSFQRQGFASEALRALFSALRDLGKTDVVAQVDHRNLPCIALLEKVGMRRASSSEVAFKGETVVEHRYRMSL